MYIKIIPIQQIQILSEFTIQKLFDESSPDDVTTSVLQNISPIFEQEWLTKNGSFDVNKDELAAMLTRMKNGRKSLLTKQEGYSMEQRGYLVYTIESFISFEERIQEMMHQKWKNRTELKGQLHNLSNDYISTLMLFYTFYDTTQEKEI